MSQAAIDVEQVVREVLRRLTSATSDHDGLPHEERAAAAGLPDTSVQHDTLVTADRVVTLAGLAGRLQDTRRLVVRPDAVVTPSVRDELRERSIALLRAPPVDRSKATAPRLYLAVCADTTLPASLVSLVAKVDPQGSSLARTSDEEAVATAEAAIAGGTAAAVVLWTERPARAACLANRHPHVRAACGWDVPSTRQAIQTMQVNLLVIDPNRHCPQSQQSVLQAFLPESARPVGVTSR